MRQIGGSISCSLTSNSKSVSILAPNLAHHSDRPLSDPHASLPVMKRAGGRFCWVCSRRRPNEQFSGNGHARCICRDCELRKRHERRAKLAATAATQPPKISVSHCQLRNYPPIDIESCFGSATSGASVRSDRKGVV